MTQHKLLTQQDIIQFFKNCPTPTEDFLIDPKEYLSLIPQPLQSAAVLIPIINREEGLTILFTERTSHLRSHAGQISFPGGAAEACDKNSHETALRETEEEIGLSPSQITVLGKLGRLVTLSGYEITPIVGLVYPPFTLNPDTREVASVFEVPLSYLLDLDNYSQEEKEFEQRVRRFHSIQWERHAIWGATAAILMGLRQQLLQEIA